MGRGWTIPLLGLGYAWLEWRTDGCTDGYTTARDGPGHSPSRVTLIYSTSDTRIFFGFIFGFNDTRFRSSLATNTPASVPISLLDWVLMRMFSLPAVVLCTDLPSLYCPSLLSWAGRRRFISPTFLSLSDLSVSMCASAAGRELGNGRDRLFS